MGILRWSTGGRQIPAAGVKARLLRGILRRSRWYNTAIVTGADQRTGDLVFRVTPEGLLSGVVTGDGGDPAEGATVMLFKKPRNHEAGGKIVQMNSEQTDDTGRMSLRG